MPFFDDLKTQLQNANPLKQKLLIEIAETVVAKGKAFVAAFVASGIVDCLPWSSPDTIGLTHRLVYRVLSQDNRAFGPRILLKLFETGENVSPIPIIHSIASFMQTFDKSADHKAVFSGFLTLAPVLTQNGGAPCYIQVITYMFTTFRIECMQLQGVFFQAIYHVLITDHARAVHDVYQLYSSFFDVEWPMEDSILLRHLEIPGVPYALLSYLIRSYTPTSPTFIHPLIRCSGEYPALAGLLLCRILSAHPEFANEFLFENMKYLQGMHVLVSARLLFLLGSGAPVRAALAQQPSVYEFLSSLVTKYAEMLEGAATLVAKFPGDAEVAARLVDTGLLSTLDEVAFRNSGDAAGAYNVVIVHAKFDQFALPRDYEALVPWLQSMIWSSAAMTGAAIAALCFLSMHADAQRVMIENGVPATLMGGDTSQYQQYASIVMQNCTR
jgi:hypothetical protein